MKKLRLIAIIALVAFSVSDTYAAGWFQSWRSERQQRQVQKHNQCETRVERPNPGPGQSPVGAPLDGGLLIILGAAGATYFGVKRKRKDS